MKRIIIATGLLSIVGAVAPLPAMAQDAARCISVGSINRSQTLKNTCNRKVEVVWCHNNNDRSNRIARCGRKGKHYQQHVVLKPGERKDNRYSLPKGARISYGACYGGYYSTKWSGSSRSYTCKSSQSASRSDRSTSSRRPDRDDGSSRTNSRRTNSRGGDGGDAKRCVSVGSGRTSQTMVNTCNRKVEVVWCHNSSDRPTRSSRCGRNGKHFQMRTVMRPGERKNNRYSLPKDARISYGACYGGYSSLKLSNGRSYRCL